MSFKKLKPEVVEALALMEITELKDYSKKLFSAIKSGNKILGIAPKGSGKTVTCTVALFNKINQQYEGSPRAIYLTNEIQEAEDLHKSMVRTARRLDVTVDLIHDKANMVKQRNDIFDGTEIIIGNPKRMCELYYQNGVNFKLLELFIVDNLDECLASGRAADIKRMIESLENKTQVVLLTNVVTKRVEEFIENLGIEFMEIEAEEIIRE